MFLNTDLDEKSRFFTIWKPTFCFSTAVDVLHWLHKIQFSTLFSILTHGKWQCWDFCSLLRSYNRNDTKLRVTDIWWYLNRSCVYHTSFVPVKLCLIVKPRYKELQSKFFLIILVFMLCFHFLLLIKITSEHLNIPMKWRSKLLEYVLSYSNTPPTTTTHPHPSRYSSSVAQLSTMPDILLWLAKPHRTAEILLLCSQEFSPCLEKSPQ